MNLFQSGNFKLHSGRSSAWKIDCDALTDADIETLALMMREILPPFRRVEGVPRGGLRLAAAMQEYTTKSDRTLIVDDVLTTGASMERQRSGRGVDNIIGAVIFARGPCPFWITPLFHMEGKAI